MQYALCSGRDMHLEVCIGRVLSGCAGLPQSLQRLVGNPLFDCRSAANSTTTLWLLRFSSLVAEQVYSFQGLAARLILALAASRRARRIFIRVCYRLVRLT